MSDHVPVPRFPIVDRDRVPVTQSCKIDGPPGTGKTTQGLCRLQVNIGEHDYGIEDVTWVTYRRSLADELIERMVKWGIIEEEQARNPAHGKTEYISTAHAVCYRLQQNEFKGLSTPTWDDYRTFCDEYYSVPYSTPQSSGQDPLGEALFDVYYWLRNNAKGMPDATDCDRYLDLIDVWPTAPSLQQFAEDWEEFKECEDLVDFYEYLQRAVENDITPGTDIVVIDEYHDAFPLLHKLAKKWIDTAETAIILGDPQQVLNHHEGASPEFFEELDLPKVQLNTTYRVPETLWKAASSVLRGYHDPHTPKFASEYDGEALVEEYSPTFRHDRRTNTWDIPTGCYGSPDYLIDHYVNENETAMFLVRATFEQHGIAAGLKDVGILFRAQEKSTGCWRQNDRRRHLFNALKRLEGYDVDGDSSVSLRGHEVRELLKYVRADSLTYSRDVVESLAELNWMKNSVVNANALDDLVEDHFWTRYTCGETSVAFLVERQGHNALPRDELMAALSWNDEPTVPVDEEGDGLEDAPSLLTIHASKGAQADRVFVYDGITKRIRRETRSNLRADANEDRVWYVALTRASKQTVIVRGAFEFLSSRLPAKGVIA